MAQPKENGIDFFFLVFRFDRFRSVVGTHFSFVIENTSLSNDCACMFAHDFFLSFCFCLSVKFSNISFGWLSVRVSRVLSGLNCLDLLKENYLLLYRIQECPFTVCTFLAVGFILKINWNNLNNYSKTPLEDQFRSVQWPSVEHSNESRNRRNDWWKYGDRLSITWMWRKVSIENQQTPCKLEKFNSFGCPLLFLCHLPDFSVYSIFYTAKQYAVLNWQREANDKSNDQLLTMHDKN